jgi:hypothetical protein
MYDLATAQKQQEKMRMKVRFYEEKSSRKHKSSSI